LSNPLLSDAASMRLSTINTILDRLLSSSCLSTAARANYSVWFMCNIHWGRSIWSSSMVPGFL